MNIENELFNGTDDDPSVPGGGVKMPGYLDGYDLSPSDARLIHPKYIYHSCLFLLLQLFLHLSRDFLS